MNRIPNIIILIVFLTSTTGISFCQLPPEKPWSTPVNPPHPDTLVQPNYLQTVHDTLFDVDITKISDASLGSTGAAIQHQYSKIQAWNSDMSLIALGFDIIIDAHDYSHFKTISTALHDARWSHTNPNIRYFGDGDYYKKINVVTDVVTTLHHFPGYGTCRTGPWEGNLSYDDRYVVITSENEKDASLYDILNDEVLGVKHFSNTFDWVSITPWGNYIAVSNNGTGQTELYDLDFNFIKTLSNYQSHADFALDSDGNQVFVEMCPIRMVRLDNLQEIDLLPATSSTEGTCGLETYNPWVCGHVSGRAFIPGWVLISSGHDDCNNGYNGFYHRTEIFILKLDGTGTVKKLGYTRTSNVDYLSQAKASMSPDGNKAIFTSDWNVNGNGGASVDYIVEYNESIETNTQEINQDLNKNIHVYPNPTIDELTIYGLNQQKTNFEIYNLIGRKIKGGTLNSNNTIHFGELKDGIYILCLKSNVQTHAFRIIKK